MPLYEYTCTDCKSRQEHLEKFDAPTKRDCPKCGGILSAHRDISRCSVYFAGTGWTDSNS